MTSKEWYDSHGGMRVYKDTLAIRRGYKNRNEYELDLLHRKGKCKPMAQNPNCSMYLGIIVAEKVLSHVFENVTRMPLENEGYDFICKKGYKIDVKSACLYTDKSKNNYNHQYFNWHFMIKRNKIADYFLCLAFDNRDALNPAHIWLIKGTDIISSVFGDKQLNNMVGLRIFNSEKSLKRVECFEQKEKLIQTISCCNVLKEVV